MLCSLTDEGSDMTIAAFFVGVALGLLAGVLLFRGALVDAFTLGQRDKEIEKLQQEVRELLAERGQLFDRIAELRRQQP